MYIINVKPLFDINRRTYPGKYESRHGNFGTTAIVVADVPEAAPECLQHVPRGTEGRRTTSTCE